MRGALPLLIALVAGAGSATAIAAFVLTQAAVPMPTRDVAPAPSTLATYVVYLSDERELPVADGLAWLPASSAEEIAARLPDAAVAGVVLDAATMFEVPLQLRQQWHRAGKMVVALDLWRQDLEYALANESRPEFWAREAPERAAQANHNALPHFAWAWRSYGGGLAGSGMFVFSPGVFIAMLLELAALPSGQLRASAIVLRESDDGEGGDCGSFMGEGPPRPESIAQIVDGAELIVVGIVGEIIREEPGTAPVAPVSATPARFRPGDVADFTIYAFHIDEVLFGAPNTRVAASIALRVPGLYSRQMLYGGEAFMPEPGGQRPPWVLMLHSEDDGASWAAGRFQALRIEDAGIRFVDFECMSANALTADASAEAVIAEIVHAALAQGSAD